MSFFFENDTDDMFDYIPKAGISNLLKRSDADERNN